MTDIFTFFQLTTIKNPAFSATSNSIVLYRKIFGCPQTTKKKNSYPAGCDTTFSNEGKFNPRKISRTLVRSPDFMSVQVKLGANKRIFKGNVVDLSRSWSLVQGQRFRILRKYRPQAILLFYPGINLLDYGKFWKKIHPLGGSRSYLDPT